MSNLEDLVPPMELCKKIPKGCFEDSALVWFVPADSDFPELGHPSVIIRTHVWEATSVRGVLPAPTLLEIMDAIDKTGCSYDFCEWDQNNITASALKAWGGFH